MIKKILVIFLCLAMICTCICLAEDQVAFNRIPDEVSRNDVQYYVIWDDSRKPEDLSMTDEEIRAILEMDLNDNGILDALEEEEDGEVSAAAIQTGILGDLNGDSLVDNKDVILLYRQIAGWEQDINSDMLDFNGDGYTNNSDAQYLMDYVSGWPNVVLYSGKKYDIIYHLAPEGMFVPEGGINNTNPDYYYSSAGLSLKNIQTDGYIFEGWYDGEGASATRIRKIDVGETGEIELYARWTARPYTITFDSNLVEVASKTYTIETGATLTNPSLANYVFVGWTNQDDGRLVNGIPKGSFGNMTLIANWASRRNLAKPVQKLGDPVIIEDSAKGKILFLYRLGDIENIPLFTLYRFSTAQGISSSVTFTEQTSISTSDARTISEAVASATTDSATWTLSEGWNENTSISQETLKQTGKTREEAETIAKSSSNTYRLDTSVSESEVIVDSSQYAYKGTVGTGTSTGHTTESGQNYSYSVDEGYNIESSIESSIGVKDVAEIKGNIKASESLNIGEEYGNYVKHSGTATDSWNSSVEIAGEDATTQTSSKNWNSNSSYSNSNSISNSHTTSEQISELIADRYGYGKSYSKNGSHSSGQAFTTQNSQQNAYSNTVTYDKSTLYTKEVTYSPDGKTDGYYRLVLAGTAHVFGLVGYDVATRSYFVYTYTVMDDNTYEFLDYSKSTPNFDDNEIGVLPFEIPSFVNDYVNAKIARSGGLEININTGKVTGYTGDESIVIIPSYVDVSNGDGTYSSVKVTGIETNAFKNNRNILGVMFSDFITDIPDSAFEGCTSLRDVNIPNLTHIGNRAFYGCTSLSAITIPEYVVSIGTNAFYNVNEVKITAANKDVALAAVNSGAKSLVLNISNINEALGSTTLEVPSGMNVFELQGERKSFQNLRVKSLADTTKINGVNFVDCTQIPLELHSTSVNLNQTTVSASGYCMIIATDNCNLNLFGTNKMISNGGNAVVCPNTTLANSDSSVQALLQVDGNIYVYGAISNQDRYLNLTNGEVISITQEQYEQYISGVYQLKFNANGGSVKESERIGYSGNPIGTLPTASRTGYTFAGWYTAPSGGTQVTAASSFISSSSVTIYAHWTGNTYTLTYDANGGTVSPTSKTITYGSAYGTLATPSRSGFNFAGWYTTVGGGTKITSSSTVGTTSNQTVYAHWTTDNWVKPNEIPKGVNITQRKWTYTLREYTSSSSASYSGWTLYDSKRTSWTAWSGWQNSKVSGNSNREVRTQTVITGYNMISYCVSGPKGRSYQPSPTYTLRMQHGPYWWSKTELDSARVFPAGSYFDYATNVAGNVLDGTGYCKWDGSDTGGYVPMFIQDTTYGTQWSYRDAVYTYYYYRDVNRESSTDPSGQDNISNVQEWVKYIY